jgi:hypothetical protein
MRSDHAPHLRPDSYLEHEEYEDGAESQVPVANANNAAPGQAPLNVAPGTANSTNNTIIKYVVDKDVKSTATAIGVMLLGMVTFTMSLFYATQFPDSDVRHATWLTLSEAISLFCAVLLFTSFKDLMVLQFGETGGSHDGIPNTKTMIISFIRLLLAFWGVQLLLMKYRHTDLPLKAWGSIGGNFVAFACIDSFGMIQQFTPFRDNPANAFLGAVIGGFLILCMCISAHVVRDYVMTYDDGVIKEHEANWNEQCKAVENQFASICLGLLVSVVIRYSIAGSLPAIWGSPHNKTQDQVNILFGVSLGMAVPVFAMSLTVSALASHSGAIPAIVRAANVTQLILSMCMGWSLVFCGQWQFWSATKGKGVGMGDKMTARMIDALIMSYISFGFILCLDFIADKMQVARGGFNAVSNAFVLGLGVAWQGAFSEALNALSHRFEDRTTRAYMDCLLTLVLCAIVLPAWVMYMLPKALAGPQPLEDDKEKETKTGEEGEEKVADEEGGGSDAQAGSDAGADVQVVCPACNAVFEGGDKFCKSCGGKRPEARKPEFCNACGSQFEEAGAQFCQNCGNKRQTEASTEEPAAPAPVSTAEPAAPAPVSTGGGRASLKGEGGKAAASGGKGGGAGGRGAAGKANVPAAPASNAGWAEPPQPSGWDEPQASSWDQQESHDDGWGNANNDDGWGNDGGGGDVSF